MFRPRLKTILRAFTILLTLLIILGAGFSIFSYFSLEEDLSRKLESKKFLVPTEFFAAPPTFYPRTLLNLEEVKQQFLKRHYRQREMNQRILPGDFYIISREQCTSLLQKELDEKQVACVGWVMANTEPTNADKEMQVLVIQNDQQVSQIYKGAPFSSAPEAHLEAPLIAQYIGTEPIMQKTTSLGEFPPMCLNAIMAIEDAQFLEHGGVSVKGIIRALVKNISSGRKAQGGSTITQQLVKNYFLSSERTLKRKFQEFIMSLLLESRFSKDQILETYLNIIYMGQNGAFQVRGYGAAAQFYFGKEVSTLNLSECSLLAAIVNSPGLYNPFKRPQNAEKRRHLVLQKLQENQYITTEEAESAQRSPLPKVPETLATETAPYYLDAVRRQLGSLNLKEDGLRVYTGLDIEHQKAAQIALQNHLGNLENSIPLIKKNASKGQRLEGSVLIGNNLTGLVTAVIGGRSFRMTQFNRAIDGHRQIGSIMKPFVYLTSLLNKNEEGQPYTPLTLLNDTPFTHKYQGQTWSPDNYGEKYFGNVPMFYALKNSANAATASLGLKIGLGNIVEVVRTMGVTSELKEVPSLTLGAFEMYPREVLQAYMTLANMGQRKKISFIRQVENSSGAVLYKQNPTSEPTIAPAAIASLVGMMKQTILSGTARLILKEGFTHPAAGKTGTTSDNRDAWFAGFTPQLTSVVWVGYDSNIPHGLTGASGAVPVWSSLMRQISKPYPPDDFIWPENTKKEVLSQATLESLNALKEQDPKEVELIFDAATDPMSH